MTNTFHLTIASVGETRFDGAAVSATLPTTAGEVTVLPHHEPLVSTLKPGTITRTASVCGLHPVVNGGDSPTPIKQYLRRSNQISPHRIILSDYASRVATIY